MRSSSTKHSAKSAKAIIPRCKFLTKSTINTSHSFYNFHVDFVSFDQKQNPNSWEEKTQIGKKGKVRF